MDNITRLNTKKCVTADVTHYGLNNGIRIETQKVYVIDGNSGCFLIQQKRYKWRDKVHSDWLVKYDISAKKEIWAYHQPTKYKTRDASGHESYTNYVDNPNCVTVISQQYFIDWSSDRMTVRDIKTGCITTGSPLGKLGSNAFIVSSKGYVLLWNNGTLECYYNWKLKWKKPLAIKPDRCFLHHRSGFVILYGYSKSVVVCNANDGSTKNYQMTMPYNNRGWCETEAGIIMCCDSVLHHLDTITGQSRIWAHLPSGHTGIGMIQTNRDYFMLKTHAKDKAEIKEHYQVHRVSSRKIISTIPVTLYIDNMLVSGIGEHVIALPQMDDGYLYLYDIPSQKLSSLSGPYMGMCNSIIPLGMDRLVCYSRYENIAIVG